MLEISNTDNKVMKLRNSNGILVPFSNLLEKEVDKYVIFIFYFPN